MSIGKNTAWGLAADAVVAGLGFALSVVLRNSLGVEQSGVYSLLTATNVLLSSIISLGIGSAASTFLARGRYTAGEVHGVALTLSLALGLLCVVGISLAFPFLHDNIFDNVPYGYLLVALCLVAATIYQGYWSAIMVGLGRLALLYQVNVTINIASALLMITAVGILHLGIPGFLASWTITSVCWTIAMLVLALRIERPVWPPRREVAGAILGFGLRSHGGNVAQQIALRFDVFAVNPLLGTASVGFYSLATNVAEKLWVPVNAIQAASLSKIAQLPREESALLTAKITRTALLMMLAVAIPFAAISPWLVPLLFPQFGPSVLPLIILLAGTTCFAVMWVLQSYIVGQMQRPGLLSILAWLQLGVSVPAYLLLIVWQGIIGAALASTLTYFIAMVGALVIFLRDSQLPLSAVFLPRAADFADYSRLLRAAGRAIGNRLHRRA